MRKEYKMIRDITIGQYYPAQSPIHKLDPRVKLFATLIYIIALFSYKGIAGVLFIVAALAAVIKISKVPFKFMVKGLKSIIILLLFTACFSVFSHRESTLSGSTVYYTFLTPD